MPLSFCCYMCYNEFENSDLQEERMKKLLIIVGVVCIVLFVERLDFAVALNANKLCTQTNVSLVSDICTEVSVHPSYSLGNYKLLYVLQICNYYNSLDNYTKKSRKKQPFSAFS